jgi:hypothetical protein
MVRRAVEAELAVDVRAGCSVAGLVAARSGGHRGKLRVTGVRTRDGAVIDASAVIVAGGSRLPFERWLQVVDAAPVLEVADGCGTVCFTRFFRVARRADEDHRVSTRLTVYRDLDFLHYEIMGADRSTFAWN